MKRTSVIVILGLFLLLILIYFYLYIGDPGNQIIEQIRFPRLLLTLITGMILASVGSSYQIILNNPLAEPYILGVSAGAAFSSILAATLDLYLLMPVFGFAGAMVTMLLVWYLSHLGGFFNSTKLLLSGIIIGLFFSALISFILYFNQQDLSSIIGVLMGNLGHIFTAGEWHVFLISLALAFILLCYLFLLSSKLVIMTTGDLVATSLGVNVAAMRKKVFIIGSILTGFTVAYAGIIGFVGLIIPHLIRMITGNTKRLNIIYTALSGAFFLILCDMIAVHITTIELPVGIVTSFIGCPFFVYILIKKK